MIVRKIIFKLDRKQHRTRCQAVCNAQYSHTVCNAHYLYTVYNAQYSHAVCNAQYLHAVCNAQYSHTVYNAQYSHHRKESYFDYLFLRERHVPRKNPKLVIQFLIYRF